MLPAAFRFVFIADRCNKKRSQAVIEVAIIDKYRVL